MGARLSKKESFTDQEGSLTINLFGPGMTALHKVGLAGLWMTLKALEKDQDASARLQKAGGSWDLTGTSVTLRWSGKPEAFFQALLKESFKIDKKGLLWFPALGAPMDNPRHAVILNEAMHGVYFQVPTTRGAEKHRTEVAVKRDGISEILRFLPFKWIAHQKCADKMVSRDNLKVVGWLYPGATRRHEIHKETALEETQTRFLCLLYLPIGAIYFRVKQKRVRPRGKDKKAARIPDFAMVLPEVRDIGRYANLRHAFLPYGTDDLTVAGSCEAGWRFLATAWAKGFLQDTRSESCRVISYGPSPGTRQKTRIELFTVCSGAEVNLRTFALCRSFFKPCLVKTDGGVQFWDIPQLPDLVARNLSEGRRWWEGFSEFVADQERRKHVFNYEKEGIGKMVADKEAFPEGPERTFVMACHEAWRRRLGQLGERARREGASFHELVRREYERQRVSFARCKNAATLREAVTDLWSRAGGPLPSLQGRWGGLLGLLDEKNWRQSKDLALLALASYKPATKEEEEALGSSKTKGKEEAGQ